MNLPILNMFLKTFYLFLCMCMGVLPACVVCVLHVCSAHGGQRRAPDTQELELEKVVNCQVGAWELNRSPLGFIRAFLQTPDEQIATQRGP